ncbi:brain acid soluble protein 1 isoform X2 [Trachinotus anak]|uniref:brain acid soluble protein 1 isoform X2 n=1 Tax=Trachinotus anak TaxID=443729 RepID=UPI0039F1F718
MGCSTSSQTSAVDTTRPSAKPEDCNGASTTGTADVTDKKAEDSETLPDQTPTDCSNVKPKDDPAAPTTSAGTTSAAPPAGEEPQPAEASPPADAAAADTTTGAADSTTGAADSTTGADTAAPEQGEDTATDSEPKKEDAPPPGE